MTDKEILDTIHKLVDTEQELYGKGDLSEGQKLELDQIEVELDQYWDLLRQRRALRRAGRNPDDAQLRPPGVVENYEQ